MSAPPMEVHFEFYIQKYHTEAELRSAHISVYNKMVTFDKEDVREYVKTWIDADKFEIWIDEIYRPTSTAMFKEGIVAFRSSVRAHIVKKE